MEIIFWFSISFVFYTYFGYPAILFTWSVLFPKKLKKCHEEFEPHVSVIIAARNEEKNIERRIRNILSQDYPRDKLDIIIISDGSSDSTNDIVEKVSKEVNRKWQNGKPVLHLISYALSMGKPHAINAGVSSSDAEIIVFADCRQRFAPDVIKHLVANFNDKSVGCVSGELIFEETPGSSIQKEMGSYWKFEKFVRKLESKIGSVAGATGAVYAIRRALFRDLPEDVLLDDVLIPLIIRVQGYRVIFDEKAVAYDVVSENFSQEKKRKVRTLAGNWQLLALKPDLLNPLRNPLWFKFLSHKIFRLLVPYFLIVLFFTSLLINGIVPMIVFLGILLFLAFAFASSFSINVNFLSKISSLCRSVFFLNYFAFLAPIKMIGSLKKIW